MGGGGSDWTASIYPGTSFHFRICSIMKLAWLTCRWFRYRGTSQGDVFAVHALLRIHETGPLALRPTPRRTCPSSGSRTAATHSGTRTTRSFERERHCPLDDVTPRYPRRKISVYRSRKPYTIAHRETCTSYSPRLPEQRSYSIRRHSPRACLRAFS